MGYIMYALHSTHRLFIIVKYRRDIVSYYYPVVVP
jgi:hypothetical protein